MNETGFLAPWLRDLGAAVGLITGLFAASKAFLEGRPFSYLEPDQVKGTLKLYVLNAGKRSIVINRSYIRPQDGWYIAPNAPNMTGAGTQNAWYGVPDSKSDNWHNHNVIIEPTKRHEFFLVSVDRDAKPTWCFILMSCQPLGGLPIPRPPLLLHRSEAQMKRLFLARKGRDQAV